MLDEEEDEEDYKPGGTGSSANVTHRVPGYHRVSVGDVFKDQYRVLKKLGWVGCCGLGLAHSHQGHFSTVWLVWDSSNERYAALKIVKSATHYTEVQPDICCLLSLDLGG